MRHEQTSASQQKSGLELFRDFMTAWSRRPAASVPVRAAFVPRFAYLANFSIRKSPKVSTRLDLGPEGGISP
jgi:hypothetical protein